MQHILQDLLLGVIVVATYIVSIIIHHFRPTVGITDILVIMAVGMIFGIVIQESTKRAFSYIKREQQTHVTPSKESDI
jgi:membrane protein CcdC involved in cytochrome C biogenesis